MTLSDNLDIDLDDNYSALIGRDAKTGPFSQTRVSGLDNVKSGFAVVMGQCQYLNSVLVFRYFYKDRSVSVFQNTVISVSVFFHVALF